MDVPQRLRECWDDTGWRAATIAAVLIFLLETFMEIGNGSVGDSVGWTAMLVSLVVIGRVLTLRPLRGDLSSIENRSLVLGIVLILLGEIVVSWTSIGGTFAAEPIFWPFSLVFMALVFAARGVAPYLESALDHWLLLFGFVVFWLQVGMWAGNVVPPAPPLTWGVMLIGAAVIVRGIIGRGFSGPLLSPLNVAVAIYAFLLLWLEYGAEISGAGGVWVRQELYWPWMLWALGLAAGARVVAPMVARRFGSD